MLWVQVELTKPELLLSKCHRTAWVGVELGVGVTTSFVIYLLESRTGNSEKTIPLGIHCHVHASVDFQTWN